MDTKNISQKLKELRKLRGMSQEFLADESHVGLRTIQRIESNESQPTGETLKRIASTLEVELEELIGNKVDSETSDLGSTIIYLKKQLSKTDKKSEARTFKSFIKILSQLKEKQISTDQKEEIESFIEYLELEKIPSFKIEVYKHKLGEFKRFLKSRLKFVPNNFYKTWTMSFGAPFVVGFSIQSGIDMTIKIAVIICGLLLILAGIYLDSKIKQENRSLKF